MPTPTIPAGNLYMNATTYTATGSTPQTITNGVAGQSFQPDLVWTKSRSAVFNNVLNDSVRGSQYYLYSNLTNAETNDSTYMTSFNSNGFSLGTGNFTNGTTMVGWQWKAGGTAVTNTSGSISSQVSANTTSGFSVVTYTGTGANATVGHGLGVAPSLVIVKGRNAVTYWVVWQSTLTGSQYLNLQLTNAVASASTVWNSTTPSSTVFSVGTDLATNGNGTTFVAYCWSEIAGFSKFGSYTGNGSSDGPFIYLGFRPRFVMIKRTDAANHWLMYDTSRDTYNVGEKWLRANAADAEATGLYWDGLSNGFKIRVNDSALNASGGTYIYMAFAENPFKYANAR